MNVDLFAWKPGDMVGIDPEMAVHKVNIKPNAKLVKQKMRHFIIQQSETIEEEVAILLKIGHIRKIQFPTYLANVVMALVISARRLRTYFLSHNIIVRIDCPLSSILGKKLMFQGEG